MELPKLRPSILRKGSTLRSVNLRRPTLRSAPATPKPQIDPVKDDLFMQRAESKVKETAKGLAGDEYRTALLKSTRLPLPTPNIPGETSYDQPIPTADAMPPSAQLPSFSGVYDQVLSDTKRPGIERKPVAGAPVFDSEEEFARVQREASTLADPAPLGPFTPYKPGFKADTTLKEKPKQPAVDTPRTLSGMKITGAPKDFASAHAYWRDKLGEAQEFEWNGERFSTDTKEDVSRRAATPEEQIGVSPEYRANVTGGFDFDTYSDRLVTQESAGKADARPIDPKTGKPRSSAVGHHQFLESTFTSIMKKYHPDTVKGMSDSKIAAMRTNPEMSKLAFKSLSDENMKTLKLNEIPVNYATMYAMHFAGPSATIKLHQADPNDPVSKHFEAAAIKANPHLKGMTVKDFWKWVAKVMKS